MFNFLVSCCSNYSKNNDIKDNFIPNSQHGCDFDKTAIKVKTSINKEFMQRPMKNDVAVVWYHEGAFSHVGFSIDDKPHGFFLCKQAPEPSSLKNYIKKKIESREGFCDSVTIQYLKISPIQKMKMQKILQMKNFKCLTCMHAVSRILDQTTDIHIPLLIRQSPDTSLIYLKKIA